MGLGSKIFEFDFDLMILSYDRGLVNDGDIVPKTDCIKRFTLLRCIVIQ